MLTRQIIRYVLVCQLAGQVAGQAIRAQNFHPVETAVSSNARRATPRRLPNAPGQHVQPVVFYEPVPSQLSKALPLSTRNNTSESQLTLEQLEQIGLNSNPAVARSAALVNALRGKWIQAGLPPNPRIGYLGAEMGDEGTAGNQGGFVAQRFITGNKLCLNRSVVWQEIIQARQQLAAQQQRVLTDVRIGYYDVLIAQRRLELARELIAVSNQAVDASNELQRAKEIPRVGLLQTEVEAQNARILLRQAQNENLAAWRRLTTVIGQIDLAPQRLAGDLDRVPTAMDWNEQLERLINESPEIATAVAELERARRALGRAYAQMSPDLNVQVSVQRDNVTDDTVTGVQVGLPIPIWNKNQGGIHQAKHEIVAAERNVQRVELKLQRQLATAFQQYSDASYQVDNFSRKILPKAKEIFDLVSEGYRMGEVGYLDMLAAQRTYFQTNLSYIEVQRELWRAMLRIEGRLLEDSLEGGSLR